jgi:hypothetical protein
VQNLLGMVSFLSSPVVGTFWSKKVGKNMFRKVPILACFLVKNPGGNKNGHKTTNFMRQYLSDVAVILHEVQQCTPNFFH